MDLFVEEFSGDASEGSEDQLLEVIRDRVVELLETDPELLFSYLYRLDVQEWKVEKALEHPPAEIPLRIAHLILQRQKVRRTTKQNTPVKKDQDWDGLEW